MTDYIQALIGLLLFSGLAIFISVRLKFFTAKDIEGRYPFLFGLISLFIGFVWQLIATHQEYNDWFIASAYTVINSLEFILFVLGSILVVVGLVLYADYWQSRRETLEEREGRQSILGNIQHDAYQPYQLLELLSISLKEMLYHHPGCSGAILLVNRVKREFVLAASSGLHKREIAMLERYPYERNPISHAIELGDPVIHGNLELYERDGTLSQGRFESVMILPIKSGQEKLGVVLLLTEEKKYFGKNEISYLLPVAGWLAEKINSARLNREISHIRSEKDKLKASLENFKIRFTNASNAFGEVDSADSFCRALTGLILSESVHIIGIRDDSLQLIANSELIYDLSESYKTALVSAIDRKKPLIVNQETTTESGRKEIVHSSFIFPVKFKNSNNALLFRRSDRPFAVDDDDLHLLEIYSLLVSLIIAQNENEKNNVSKRKGFDLIRSFLNFEKPLLRFKNDSAELIEQIAKVFSHDTIIMGCSVNNDQNIHFIDGINCDKNQLDQIVIYKDEGAIGKSLFNGKSEFITGSMNIVQSYNEYDPNIKAMLLRLTGERDDPAFFAVCPILRSDGNYDAFVIIAFESDSSLHDEWRRLLTLISGLYSLRLQLSEKDKSDFNIGKPHLSGTIKNRINNHLSAVIGNAELISKSDMAGDDIKESVESIISESEQAASLINQITSEQQKEESIKPLEELTLNTTIKSLLKKGHISGDLYMIGGRPREINLYFSEDKLPLLNNFKPLFEALIDQFSNLTEEEDVISIETYIKGDAVYLDISRHRKNFPAVDHVSEFGRYLSVPEAINQRPADSFLKHVTDENCYYAVDRNSQIPSYLSFRFPIDQAVKPEEKSKSIKILVIDDHDVIRDLVKAMGSSLGYHVESSATGQDGLFKAMQSEYSLILTDLALPDISGLEVAAKIHSSQPNLPIILITGWGAEISQKQLDSVGIKEILDKPFRVEQLTRLVNSLVLHSVH